MGRTVGPRTFLVVSVALAMLLAALAGVQYRWSMRVSAADEQREREHLDSAAALFANEFNGMAAQAIAFLQNDATAALRAGQPLGAAPRLIAGIYSVELRPPGAPAVERLDANGRFEPASLPEWLPEPRCDSLVIGQPPAIVAPVFDVATEQRGSGGAVRLMRTIRREPGRCFVAVLDATYLRQTLFPQLIRQGFGETVARDYDFAIVSMDAPHTVLYGSPAQADLRHPPLIVVRKRLVQIHRRRQVRIQTRVPNLPRRLKPLPRHRTRRSVAEPVHVRVVRRLLQRIRIRPLITHRHQPPPPILRIPRRVRIPAVRRPLTPLPGEGPLPSGKTPRRSARSRSTPLPTHATASTHPMCVVSCPKCGATVPREQDGLPAALSPDESAAYRWAVLGSYRRAGTGSYEPHREYPLGST